MPRALIIGGGPAGLMAADALVSAGIDTTLCEAKPSLARKFLMAGKSGLNLTRMQDIETFLNHYSHGREKLEPMLRAFPPDAIKAWAEGLGQDTFTGSTLRLFPKVMKASPLLRAWLARLDGMGLAVNTRWRWTGWDGVAHHFDTPDGPTALEADVTIFALGGGSWARLGSDGAWTIPFAEQGLPVAPFSPSNAGLIVPWSAHMTRHFGAPLKNVRFQSEAHTSRGEAVISKRGLEGGAIYPLTPALREGAALYVDLCPDIDAQTLINRLSKPRGKQSLSNVLRKSLKLNPAAQALLMECGRPLPPEPAALATLVKHLPVPHQGPRPIDEAISTAGGLKWDALTVDLMLKSHPGTYCAGEMLDWDAPTGGYLLSACLATGLWAGQAAAKACLRA
ncbi:TIGR03862 family flavoprotein [Pacificoceanicola onchidii]|uniref:TIGR03862 family flavoprotein n=1 Tax=Pacificoceanicola onchidii TaxID=2562685 RepID=UPI0010A5E721|nr:TIGR03862 family flavoprotein [Pacificoceanicola onchidii]